jgi:hypothetical protein
MHPSAGNVLHEIADEMTRELIEAGVQGAGQKVSSRYGRPHAENAGAERGDGETAQVKPKKRMTWTKHCTGSGRTFARRKRHGRAAPQ